MPVTIYPFNVPTNYTYSTDVVVSGSSTSLDLSDRPTQSFTEDFADGVGFTFDTNLVEFTGGQLRQKDQLPDTICGATFTDDINLLGWSAGALTGVPQGGAAIVGTRLDLAHDDIRYVDLPGLNNISTATQQGCVRMKWTPNYSGNPTSNQVMFHMGEGVTSNNNVTLLHSSSGQGSLTITDSSGGSIVAVALGTFSPTVGATYELELNWDVTAGETRIFVNGVQFNGTQIGTGSRTATADVLRIGSNATGTLTSNCFVEDVMVFDAVQHTSDYTPGYIVLETRYAEAVVTCPAFTYTDLGTLQQFTAISLGTSAGSPHFSLNNLYWNGTGWAVTADTYATASLETALNLNITSLTASATLIPKIIFTDTNTQSVVDTLAVEYTGQWYSQTNPSIRPNTTFGVDGISAFTSSVNAAGSDTITFTMELDGAEMYWDGAAWANSSGYAQSNTSADISTNITSLTNVNSNVRPVAYLHSADGSSTPTAAVIAITYSFGATTPSEPETCVVNGWVRDSNNQPAAGATIKATPDVAGNLETLNFWISKTGISVTSDANGYWELELLRSSIFETPTTYTFGIVLLNETKISKKYQCTIPDLNSLAYIDL